MAVAEVLDIGMAGSGAADSGGGLDGVFESVLVELARLPADVALAGSNRFQNRLLAFDAGVIAARIAAGADSREAEDLAGRGTTRTKAEAKKRVRRAKAVDVNPSLGADLADGGLGPEQLDAIAHAAEKTDGAATCAVGLIEDIKASNPDDAKKLANEWVDHHTTPDEHEKRRDRQRRLRKVIRYRTVRGTKALHAEGDTETITEIWNVLTAASKKLFKDDGGRDVPAGKHPRTRSQRLYDALHQTITGTGAGGGSGSGRPRIYVTATIDDFIDDQTRARLVGGGTIPKTLLQQYLPDAMIVGVLFDGEGHVLWHGRNKRYATIAQMSALLVRDEGCVLCGAHPDECVGHHLIPYNSPAHGNTNTDEMAPVDSDCHHHIHANQLTLYPEPHPTRPGKLAWKLRPATPDEIPP